MSTLWEVTNFSLRTSAKDSTADSLYANGQMQVKVIVSIKAKIPDPDDGPAKDYTLTADELKTIKLIYYDTRKELSGEWSYSTTENDFAHVLPGGTAPAEPIADGTQAVIFWVSSTKLDHENIAAQVSQPGKDEPTIIDTTGGSYHSMVTLVTLQPITYTTSNVSFTREDTAEGTWKKKTWSATWTYKWDQDNYYLSSKFYPFLKVDRKKFVTNDDRFAYLRVDGSDISMFYMFNMGEEETVQRGITSTNVNTTLERRADIRINQQKNAFCLTRLRFFNGWSHWEPNWNQDAWFTIYDLYGNHGQFWVNTQGQNTLSITSRNGSTSSGPTAKI
ncbi:uncharacterized protein LDX57_006443 [Aspergillus melleus]|uniref:uncharacterized protein n=1 Tax=Aspergillus melleus TaxID=138277 RepID=UPI001E8E66B8|nr:uncharacterized protein LDX57_006443 [Aspergillus melleus]KAH8428759.1 hypothetical protein LDX57_006443 [Aspergillus melleus]